MAYMFARHTQALHLHCGTLGRCREPSIQALLVATPLPVLRGPFSSARGALHWGPEDSTTRARAESTCVLHPRRQYSWHSSDEQLWVLQGDAAVAYLHAHHLQQHAPKNCRCHFVPPHMQHAPFRSIAKTTPKQMCTISVFVHYNTLQELQLVILDSSPWVPAAQLQRTSCVHSQSSSACRPSQPLHSPSSEQRRLFITCFHLLLGGFSWGHLLLHGCTAVFCCGYAFRLRSVRVKEHELVLHSDNRIIRAQRSEKRPRHDRNRHSTGSYIMSRWSITSPEVEARHNV